MSAQSSESEKKPDSIQETNAIVSSVLIYEKDEIASDYVPGAAIHLPPDGTAVHDERWLTIGNAYGDGCNYWSN